MNFIEQIEHVNKLNKIGNPKGLYCGMYSPDNENTIISCKGDITALKFYKISELIKHNSFLLDLKLEIIVTRFLLFEKISFKIKGKFPNMQKFLRWFDYLIN